MATQNRPNRDHRTPGCHPPLHPDRIRKGFRICVCVWAKLSSPLCGRPFLLRPSPRCPTRYLGKFRLSGLVGSVPGMFRMSRKNRFDSPDGSGIGLLSSPVFRHVVFEVLFKLFGPGLLAGFHGIVVPSAVDTIIFKVVARHLFIRTIAIFSSWFTFQVFTFGSSPTYFIRMRHVLVPLHIAHATVWFTAYQTGVAIDSHVNSVISLDEMMRGEKTWPFIQSHAAHGKCDAADGKLDAAWQQTRRRWWTDFDSFLRRNGTLMHIQRDLWPRTLTHFYWFFKQWVWRNRSIKSINIHTGQGSLWGVMGQVEFA